MNRPHLSLIAAVARNRAIGKDNALLVHLPDDLPRFKRMTMGAPLIMGRKTWDSIGRPLPGRRSIVITRNLQWHAQGAEAAHSLEAALALVASAPKAFVIGGAEIYALALLHADELLLTEIDADFDADAFFPEWSRADFVETERQSLTSAQGMHYSFVTYNHTRGDDMSGAGFHVHGPHDHELEHAAQHEPEGFAGKLAVMTAVIATIGALFAYMGGATQANAGLYKNDAAIKKTEASNQWNFYQAKSGKQNLAELAIELAPEARKAFYAEEVKRYSAEKKEIKVVAEKFEAESKDWDKKSEEQLHQHHRWAQATTVLQIAIAMAAIALLTKSKRFAVGVIGLSGLGLCLGVLAWLHI